MKIIFAPQARLVIEPAARLTIRNTTLTVLENHCYPGCFWQGVELQGTESMSQSSSIQGWFFMYSNSTVERALVGVNTEIEGITQSGARIYASSSTFKNNIQDVNMMKYPGNSYSSFSNCNFITTDAYNGDCSGQGPAHVTLNSIMNLLIFTDVTLSIQGQILI